MIRVFLLCRTCLYRDGIARLVAAEADDIRIEGTASDARSALDSIRASSPDVVLVDIGAEGDEALVEQLVDTLPETKVIALGLADTGDELIRYAEAGIAGFVSREDGTIGDLIAAIRSAHRGEVICSPRAAAALLRHVSATGRSREVEAPRPHFTARQLEVVRLIDSGLSNKEIAQRLHIELPTVKNHLHAIFEKLNVSRRTEAVARARAYGLVPPASQRVHVGD